MRRVILKQDRVRGRRRNAGGGFSLVELVTVMVLVSLLAAVALPTLSAMGSTRSAFAAGLVFKDLTLARERAVATGRSQYMVFAPNAGTYTFLYDDAANPGRANAPLATDPSSGRPFVRTLGAGDTAGVGIASAAFDSGAEVGFDWRGRPLNSQQNPLQATGTVTLTGGASVRVLAGSGLVSSSLP